MSMSLNGGLPWRVTTRIISSGVTPFAHSEAMNDAGRGADVDVEVVDRAVDRQQVERAQRADLVDAAGEAAAAEHERGLVAARTPAPVDRRRAADPPRRDGRAAVALALEPRLLEARFQLDNLAHRRTF